MSTVDAAATAVNTEVVSTQAEVMGASLATAVKEGVAKAQQTISKAAITVVNNSEAIGNLTGSQLKIPYQTAKGFFKGFIKGLEKPL